MRTASLVLAVAVMAGAIGGCATSSGGGDPVEQLKAVMGDFIAAQKAKDVEKCVAFFSDDFESDQGTGKDSMTAYYQGLVDQGVFDDIEVSMENCEFAIDGNTVTVGPVDYETPAGGASYEYEFTKESDGIWRITYSGTY